MKHSVLEFLLVIFGLNNQDRQSAYSVITNVEL